MTATELKHQAREEKWLAAIGECRSSGLSVWERCSQKGITSATYYRWEREVLSKVEVTTGEHRTRFVEPHGMKQEERNVPERSATLLVGEDSVEIYQDLSPELLKALAEALRGC